MFVALKSCSIHRLFHSRYLVQYTNSYLTVYNANPESVSNCVIKYDYCGLSKLLIMTDLQTYQSTLSSKTSHGSIKEELCTVVYKNFVQIYTRSIGHLLKIHPLILLCFLNFLSGFKGQKYVQPKF